MILSVTHETVYTFDRPMRGVLQSHRLTPSDCASQQVRDWHVSVDGAQTGAAFRDGAGDWTYTMAMREAVTEITIGVRGTVETTDQSGVLRGHREMVPPLAYLRDTRATAPDQQLRDLAAEALALVPDETDVLARAHALSGAVSGAITYKPGETDPATSAAEALSRGVGVCQDHAHALIACALIAGIPARYVVGYLHSSADGSAEEASHAWAELHVERLGWVGFDPANECCPNELYIRLCSGFDAQDAAPIRGVALGEGAESLKVSVAVMAMQQ